MEFDDLGARCFLKSCNIQDYLPYTCTFCNHTFCHTHRSPTHHSCTPSTSTNTVIECSDCKKILGTSRSDEEGARMLRSHYQGGVCGEGRSRGKKGGVGKKCGGCGKKMGFGGGLKCKGCDGSFCVECRLEKDHGCVSLKKRNLKNGGAAGVWGSWVNWDKARRIWGVGNEGKKGGEQKGWGIWVRVGGVKKVWVKLEEKWSVGKVVDLVGEKVGLEDRDEEGRRLELMAGRRVLGRLEKIGDVAKRGMVIDVVREKGRLRGGAVSCSVEVKNEGSNHSADLVSNVSC